MHFSFLTTKFSSPYFCLQQVSNFSKMTHSRNQGLPNSRPRRRVQIDTPSQENPVFDPSDEQNWPSLNLNASSKTKHPQRASAPSPHPRRPVSDTRNPHHTTTQPDSVDGALGNNTPMCSGNITPLTQPDSTPCSFQVGTVSIPLSSGNLLPQLQITVTMHATQAYSMAAPLQNGSVSGPVFSQNALPSLPLKNTRDGAMGNTSPVGSINGISQIKETSATKESVKHVTKIEPSKSGSNRVIQHHSPGLSRKFMPQSTKNSPKEYHHSSSDHIRPFDICRLRDAFHVRTSSVLEMNKERWKYIQILKDDPRPSFLRPGMVLLKNYISCDDQIKIVKTCRKLGIGPGGFYQPCFSNGAKLRLYMMCLGKDWDPQRKSYGDIRFIDGASPPTIPDAFRKLVSGAIQASHAVIENECVRNPDDFIPWMQPDICIMNFYTKSGKLGLHQDRDESLESINKGLPVVSFSIGDSAEFLYGDERDVDKAEKVELKSGDVLIFGGESRLVFHGVTAIIPDSAPKFLANEAHLLPGRLNLTFREY